MNRPLNRLKKYCMIMHFYPAYKLDDVLDLSFGQIDALVGGMNQITESRR